MQLFKKITFFVLAMMCALSFAGCKDKAQNNPVPATKPQTSGSTEPTEYEKDIPQETVDVEGATPEDIEKYAKDNGADKVTIDKDGKVEVDMADKEYDAMMDKLGKSILAKLEEIRQSNDMIESVQTGLDFDKYYIFVDKAKYDANPSVIDISSCCNSAEVYQALSGKKTRDIKITLYIMNVENDIEICRKVYNIK